MNGCRALGARIANGHVRCLCAARRNAKRTECVHPLVRIKLAWMIRDAVPDTLHVPLIVVADESVSVPDDIAMLAAHGDAK